MKKYIISLVEEVENEESAQSLLFDAGIKRSFSVRAQGETGAAEATEEEFVFLDKVGLLIAVLTEEEKESVEKSSTVLAVEEDIEVRAHGVVPASDPVVHHPGGGVRWNMDMIRADWVWHSGSFGSGVKVAILDTGIAAHVNLRTYGGTSFIPSEPDFRDGHGHGTHCAGIVAGKGRNDVFGVAFGAELYAVKVLDRTGSGSSSGVVSGMDWCISAGMNVVSMSLGSPRPPRASYANAIRRCQSRGIVVVCSAGNGFNSGFPWVGSPANSFIVGDPLGSPIAVASVDSHKGIAFDSSRGTNGANWNPVTVAAPGVSILSTFLNGAYARLSGTSMACPHVSGLAALIIESNPGISVQIVKALMTLNTEQLGAQPIPNDPYGHGLIDCAASVGVVTVRKAEDVAG
ncbi:MAG: S8 family serine peptidase [Nisaea sp.]|uniref:S8 family peptidase n=1 Tax=Nisaea sp. TaxID=2024842 RepID=UPI003298BE93